MKTASDWLIKEIGGDLYEHRCSAFSVKRTDITGVGQES
jgi:hypothetical protein